MQSSHPAPQAAHPRADVDACDLCTVATKTAQAHEIARLRSLLERALEHVGYGADPRLEAEIRLALLAPEPGEPEPISRMLRRPPTE